MLKRVVTFALAALLLALPVAPSLAMSPTAEKSPPLVSISASASVSPRPGQAPAPSVLQRIKNPQSAQAIGFTCTNGLFWCRPGGYGPIGGPCCCPAFCGWIVP